MSDELSNETIDGVNPVDPIEPVDSNNNIPNVSKPTTSSTPESAKSTTTKKPVKKTKPLIDKTQLIFFGVLFVGLIIFVIIMVYNNSKQKYTTTFGDNITATVKINDDVFELEINADGTKSSQTGKCTKIKDTNKYSIEFEDKTKAECEILEDKDKLILYYKDQKIEFSR